jgi:DNA-binding MarR family transcriptional regulator
MLVLRASSQLIDEIHRGVHERGFTDVRPTHGFAFVRISMGDATIVDVAEHLGVTKQAASQLVEQLVQRGYVERVVNPRDGRSQWLALTARGWECTRAAEQAAADVSVAWERQLGPAAFAELQRGLRLVVQPGRLRPAW